MSKTPSPQPVAAFQFLAPAAFDAADASQPGERRLTGVAYSGDIITDHPALDRVAIDLATVSIEPPIPLLNAHNHGEPVGMVTAAPIVDGELRIESRLFCDVDVGAAEIAAKADKGFPWQQSVGIFDGSPERVPKGKTIELNGRRMSGPLTVIRNARIREVSVCALGADHRTSAHVFNAGERSPITTEEPPEMADEPNPLQVQLEAAQAENATLRAELDQIKAAQRDGEIQALFTAIGREFTAESAQPYRTLSAEQFSAIAADMQAQRKPALPDKLTTEMAAGRDVAERPNFADMNAKILAQLSAGAKQ